MGRRIQKKHEAGAATNYISRNSALRKLQLSLKDFRRLCILKGVYPHEPRHKKKVNKGSTEQKTWFYVKDIQFLAHEPIIQKFREQKVFARRLKKACEKRDREKEERVISSKPTYSIDHIVKERYPSFTDALRDIDDALSMCFLFARMPKSSKVNEKLVEMCHRLTAEFQHFCIESRALRKVFVSIKGIYYQVEIMGQTVTWIVPHERGYSPTYDVDFSVMTTFLQFYVCMLGFVNFKLFQSLGIFYPPKLSPEVSQENFFDKDEMPERIYSLNQPLLRSEDVAKIEKSVLDEFELEDEKLAAAKKSQKKIDELKKLFEGCRIFIGRECPRESLTFVIRSCGGEVSWDPTIAYGSTFAANDPSITHQIVDRPSVENQDVNRWYLQPQWIFDSINARMRIPKENYFPGANLPPHLSPFVAETAGDYVPPEKLQLMEIQGEDTSAFVENEAENRGGLQPPAKKSKKSDDPAPQVTPGRERIEKPSKKKEEKKLQEMTVPKRFRMAYKKMKFGEKRKEKETKKLREKRKKAEKNV